ncbi:Cadherin-18 [Bagarius yarrelli]|uniref:Cadherin-18 n=1 Tax=Bagarius yarrelli TaxID=175774 RepID=A0A556U6J5_BAGYA|nr:Cadherin-18 [Bagarius yarrelli]
MRACLSSLLLGLFALQRSLGSTSTAGLDLNTRSHNRTRLHAGSVFNAHTHNRTRLPVEPVLHEHTHNRTRLSIGSVLNAHTQNRTKLPEGGKDPHHRPKRGWVWNQFYVLEEHIGPEPQYVGKLHSNSDKGDGSVRYLLSGDGAGTIFTINESTGDIHATKSLDREKKNQYVLHARAVHSVTHHIVEPESEFIIKITATDADDPTYGNSARIVYSVLQGQAYFTIDPKTGVIRTAVANMDRETREMYSIIIQAKDMAGSVGGLSGSTTVNITLADVNDNPPRFPQKNYQLYVPESAQVGKAVGKIKANDEDLGINAEMEYKVTNEDGAAMFSISVDSSRKEGVISLRKHLDYETKKAYTLNIEGANTHLDPRFSHLGPFRDTTTLKIIIGDVDEAPIFPMDYYIMDVYENMPAETDVGIVTAQDPDNARGKIRYSIDKSTDGEMLFSIDENSGLIKTMASLDREGVAWHNITVRASEAVQVLDMNDNTPYVESDSDIIVLPSVTCYMTKETHLGSMSLEAVSAASNKSKRRHTQNLEPLLEAGTESQRVSGSVIQTIRAKDRDNFANGRFSFALPADIPANPNFTLKDNEDSSASIVARRWGFSRADQELHQLAVVVWDGGEPALSSTTTLTLRVCACQRGLRAPTCRPQAFFSSAGLSTGALIAILLCVLILLAIVVLFITLRSKKSKKETLIISEEDIRENVVTYDDEGGGEEDTEAFDMAALRNPEAAGEAHKKCKRRKEEAQCETFGAGVKMLSTSRSLPNQDIQEVLQLRVVEADQDTTGPPYDSLQTYAYEGQGSPSGSISSLDLPDPPNEPDTLDLGASWPDVNSLMTIFQDRGGQHTL